MSAARALLYLPVIHTGYLRFLARYDAGGQPWILGRSFAVEFPVLDKEIRALTPERAARLVGGAVVERNDLAAFAAAPSGPIVVPDEELMRELVARYGLTVTFERTFLRWDRSWSRSGRPPHFDGTVAVDDLTRALMARATDAAGYSSDWWRQVGAVATRNGTVLDTAYNEHLPTEYAPYINGDPRNDFSRGVRADLSTALHAEAAIVARAARAGVSLGGADLYVSTFPCPACARLIAAAGFGRVFFAGSYAVLDGDEVLRAAGVELVWVEMQRA